MTKQDLSLARLREVLNYDPATGQFIWIKPTSNRVKAGSLAAVRSGHGYLRVSIDGVTYYAHRLAWMWVHGAMPPHEIDHCDGDRANNRAANLRDASHSDNSQNQGLRSTNKSGYHGVSWHAQRSKWTACIHVNGKKRHLGLFNCPEQAGRAYLAAKMSAHPFQPVPRDVRAA